MADIGDAAALKLNPAPIIGEPPHLRACAGPPLRRGVTLPALESGDTNPADSSGEAVILPKFEGLRAEGIGETAL